MPKADSTSKRTKCLLVDDHAGFRQTVREFLPGAEIDVVECADGAAALLAYEQHRPDWVVMDVSMPVLDGLQATRQIRARHPEARIVMLSQYASADTQGEALAAGARAFVSKADLPQLNELLSGRVPSQQPGLSVTDPG